MAEEGKEEDVEYESDPEETKLSLKMRRREASDDEEEEERRHVEDGVGREKLKPRRRVVDSDAESDEQGSAADYDDDDDEEDGGYVEDDGEIIGEDEDEEYLEEEEEDYEKTSGELERPALDVVDAGKQRGNDVIGAESTVGLSDELSDDKINNDNRQMENQDEEKKENEPYAVPTAGAFYMHDDRFRDNAGGRHRRTFGGRKLWESKDDRKWGHDKFEELTMQERHYEEGRRSSRGQYRGRGRNRGPERRQIRGRRPREYNSSSNPSKSNNHSVAPKTVRGRGPRRYQPSFKQNNEVSPAQNQQSRRTVEKSSHTGSGRMSAPTSNVESETVPAKKHVFASSLNSASPPFYPSNSSSKDINLTPERDVLTGAPKRNVHPTVVDEGLPIAVAQSSAMQRGKSVVDSLGMDKLYIDNSIPSVAGKPLATLQVPPSGSSTISSAQPLQLRAQGRGINSLAPMTYQPTASNSQANRAPASQFHSAQRAPVQNRGQSSTQSSALQFAQNSVSGSQVSSPPKPALSKSSLEPGEVESPLESSKSKSALVSKGKGNPQGGGRGSFLYGGAQVMGASGNMGGGPGDQNFPTFLPIMQFGGQHPGGIGVPAVGMAFPGYVGNPQLGGLGNSEMTWLPVLAGAAGALGATYCSPYIAVDGAYHPRPSGQTSSLAPASIKEENNTNKLDNEWKPVQRTEVANDDFGQRQKNPRRYTEMKFDQ